MRSRLSSVVALSLVACGGPPPGENTCENGVSDPGEACLVLPGFLPSPAPLLDGVLVDLTQDGRPELVAAASDGSVIVFRGDPGGGLLAPSARDITSAGASESVALARRILAEDIDGNGIADVIVALQEIDAAGIARGEVAVLFSNGDGTFQAPRVSPLAGPPAEIALADLNGDEVLDLLAVVPGAIETRRLDASGLFVDPRLQPINLNDPQAFLLQDINEDSTLDLLIADRLAPVARFFGSPDGTFTDAGALTLAPSFALASFDFSGDGKDDIASASLGNSVLELGRGVGNTGDVDLFSVAFVGEDARALSVLDLNRDGLADLLSVGGSVLSIHPGAGGGLLGTARLLWGGSGLFDLLVEDLTLDQIPDLIGLHALGAALFPGRPGDFPAGTPFLLSQDRPKALAVLDFDKDGDEDAAVSVNQGIALLESNRGALREQATLPLEPTPLSLSAADLDGDGDADLIALDPQDPLVPGQSTGRVLRNEKGSFPAQRVAPLSGLPAGATALFAGNFDAAPGADLLVLGESPALLSGDGAGRFGAPQLLNAGAAESGTVADIDADGAPDIVLVQGESARLLFGPAFTEAASVTFSGPLGALVAAPLDSGPGLSLIGAVPARGTVETARLDAGRALVLGPGVSTGIGALGLGSLDLDGDGFFELLAVGDDRALVLGLREGALVARPVFGANALPLGGISGEILRADLAGDGLFSLLVVGGTRGILVLSQSR
jgi:hypothetical protein